MWSRDLYWLWGREGEGSFGLEKTCTWRGVSGVELSIGCGVERVMASLGKERFVLGG